jgi:hypothetical protein
MNDQRASQRRSQSMAWPGGKPIAVLVSILFETWSEGKAPSYFPRTTPLKPGTVDRGAIQWAQYGGNEGLWRILRTLDRHGVPATIFCSGRCGTPRTFFDVYKDTFEYLREHEPMGLLHIGFHSHFGGRPLMTAMFDKLLGFLQAQPEVHFPGHNPIARWMLERAGDELSYANRFFG